MLLEPIQNGQKCGLPLICTLRAPVSHKVPKHQIHHSKLGLFLVLERSRAGAVFLSRHLRQLLREAGVHLNAPASFLKVRRIAELVAYRLLCGRLPGVPRLLALEHPLGEERILLQGVDAVRQSIGEG